jgi:hypothetical protein
MLYRVAKNQELIPCETSFPFLKDILTGESVEIVSPSRFVLETVLMTTAYYRSENREYRFRLPDARIAGLKIEK